MIERVVAYFEGLSDVVEPAEVRLSGAWTEAARRRDAEPEPSGSGEGPFVEEVDWRWDGALEGASAFTGLALLVTDLGFDWVKAQPAAVGPKVSASITGWPHPARTGMFAGSFHGAQLPTLVIDKSSPDACLLGDATIKVGTVHVVARLRDAALAVVVLPGSALKVGRNRLWHARESVTAPLRPELALLLTRRRSGWVDMRR